MVDLLEQGAAWLGDLRANYASHPVVYSRVASSVTLRAALGSTNTEFQDASGMIEQYQSRDFIVQAAELILGGVAVLPQRGDRIEITLGGVLCVFEVLAPTGMECWKWSDPYRKAIRVHTKEVAAS